MKTRNGRLWSGGCLLALLSLPGLVGKARAKSPKDEIRILRGPTQDPSERDSVAPASESLPLPEWRHWAVGVDYLGGQLRWRPSARWAFETDYQQGKAPSDYGDVTARIFGLRSYRFFRPRSRWSLYVGPELAYATAKPETSEYRTAGFVAGAFMGSELNVTRRIALDLDIGPYMISLKEKQTGLSQTNLDFVIQTALLFNLF